MNTKVEQGTDAVVAIENLEAIGSKCKRHGCVGTTCRQNPNAVPSQASPGRFGIPIDDCPDILGFISDDQFDVITRYWVEHTFIDKETLPKPAELRELLQGQGVHDAMPIGAVQAVLDGLKWPPQYMDERCKKAHADFCRQLVEGSPGSEQVSVGGWWDQMHNVQGNWSAQRSLRRSG